MSENHELDANKNDSSEPDESNKSEGTINLFGGTYELKGALPLTNKARSIRIIDGYHLRLLKDVEERSLLREWWHRILREHGSYSCYAIFLLLPSDKEAIRYLTDFGKELDLISADRCLIVALGQSEFTCFDLDKEIRWKAAVEEQASEGYSIKVAQLFDIKFDEFPCFVVFQDIRSPEHVKIPLKEMTAEDIAEKIRWLFSAVRDATLNRQNPLNAIQSRLKSEKIQRVSQKVAGGLQNFVGKTFETAMETLMKAVIK